MFIQKEVEGTALPQEVLDALRRIWDGSHEHAAALATLIRASGELWPDLSDKPGVHDR